MGRVPDDSDPMLVDLARRLENRGLRVALGHRGKLGLVTSFWGKCLTIETDMVLHDMSLRESLRLRPDLLRRLGWHYLRVHAFELFSDPDAVADRVVDLLGARKDPATGPIVQTTAVASGDGPAYQRKLTGFVLAARTSVSAIADPKRRATRSAMLSRCVKSMMSSALMTSRAT